MAARSKPKGPPRGSATKRVALPRFQKQHWAQWLELAADRTAWEASYDEWRQAVEERAKRLRQAGLDVAWIDLEPEPFQAWCQVHGYANDAESRNRYAAEQIGNIPPRAGGENR